MENDADETVKTYSIQIHPAGFPVFALTVNDKITWADLSREIGDRHPVFSTYKQRFFMNGTRIDFEAYATLPLFPLVSLVPPPCIVVRLSLPLPPDWISDQRRAYTKEREDDERDAQLILRHLPYWEHRNKHFPATIIHYIRRLFRGDLVDTIQFFLRHQLPQKTWNEPDKARE